MGLFDKETVDFIENLIGTTGNISESIQRVADKRNEVLTLRINDIIGTTGGGAPLYKRYTNNTEILPIQDNLLALEDEIKAGGDIVIQQYYESVKNDLETSMGDNVKFQNDKKKFTNSEGTGIEDLLKARVDDYMATQDLYGAAVSPEKKALAEKEIQDLLFKYGTLKEGFLSYFGERVTTDADLYNSIMTVETYTKFILQEMMVPSDGGPGVIDEETFHMFNEGLFEGNMEALKRYSKKKEIGLSTSINTLLKSIDEDWLALQQKESHLDNLFGNGGDAGFRDWAVLKGYDLETMGSADKKVLRGTYNSEYSQYRKNYIIPLETRMKNSDNSYKQLTQHSHLEHLQGGATRAPKHNILPDPIVESISEFRNDKAFVHYGKKDLNILSKSIINDIELAITRNEEWWKNKNITDALIMFEEKWDLVSSDIKLNEEAKKLGFKSMADIEAFKNIDIAKIREYIGDYEVYNK